MYRNLVLAVTLLVVAFCIAASQPACHSGDWSCSRSSSPNCIPLAYLCDGPSDCAQGEDEEDALCAPPSPATTYIRMSQHCNVPAEEICDGEFSCLDGTDEDNCACRALKMPTTHRDLTYTEATNYCKGLSTSSKFTAYHLVTQSHLDKVLQQNCAGRLDVDSVWSAKCSGPHKCRVLNIAKTTISSRRANRNTAAAPVICQGEKLSRRYNHQDSIYDVEWPISGQTPKTYSEAVAACQGLSGGYALPTQAQVEDPSDNKELKKILRAVHIASRKVYGKPFLWLQPLNGSNMKLKFKDKTDLAQYREETTNGVNHLFVCVKRRSTL